MIVLFVSAQTTCNCVNQWKLLVFWSQYLERCVLLQISDMLKEKAQKGSREGAGMFKVNLSTGHVSYISYYDTRI